VVQRKRVVEDLPPAQHTRKVHGKEKGKKPSSPGRGVKVFSPFFTFVGLWGESRQRGDTAAPRQHAR